MKLPVGQPFGIVKKVPSYRLKTEASMLAGRAFSNTKTTACHSISYPLTLRYGIPHGVAVSMLLPALLCINENKIEDKELLLNAYGAKTLEEAGQKIIHLLEKAEISYKLSDWKVKKEELNGIAENCFTKGRMENNPVDQKKFRQVITMRLLRHFVQEKQMQHISGH